MDNVVLMKSFTAWNQGLMVTHKPVNRNDVCVFLLLGTEPKDGSNPLDIDAAMGRLGWVRKDAIQEDSKR